MLVYVDEAGDLGFTEKSTKFFAVAYVACDQQHGLERCLSRLLKDLHARRKYSRKESELKWSRSNNEVRRRVLETIRDLDLYLGCIVLNKANVHEHLRNPPILYNYQIVHFMLWDLLPINFNPLEGMKVYIDLSMRRDGREAFNKYFRSKAHWIWTMELHKPSFDESRIQVIHENSEKVRCLQAADYVAGAAFTKFERGTSFFDIIEKEVRLVKVFF